MTYGIRNTIILLVALILITAGGYFYLYYFQKRSIEELELTLDEQVTNYEQLSDVASYFQVYEEQVNRADTLIESFDKTLFLTSNPDQVYKLLSEIGDLSPDLEFNFIYNSTSETDQYGIISTSISGFGPYRQMYDFINRIENSMPVQKIEELLVTPINQPEQYGQVNFSFVLNSYFDLTNYFNTPEEAYIIELRAPDQFQNPFYPLIREIEPNTDDLVNVETSRLIGMSSNRIYLRDQNGRLVNLSVGDPVYLGTVTLIGLQAGRAEFRLNKGGIIETVTLEVQP